MRIAVSALIGVLLAGGTALGAVQLANASQKDPVIKPLYNYGSR
ncbi:hypothetical protein ACIBF1_24565 [Spirillospora sp. NPDC050679]